MRNYLIRVLNYCISGAITLVTIFLLGRQIGTKDFAYPIVFFGFIGSILTYLLYSLRDFRFLNVWNKTLIPVVNWEFWVSRRKWIFFMVNILEIYAKATTLSAVVALIILGSMTRARLLTFDVSICVNSMWLLMLLAMALAISRRLWRDGREERFRILTSNLGANAINDGIKI
jgi:FlaA1/EpsC-like NDP-sugar epimerase